MVAVADHAARLARHDLGKRSLAVFERRTGQVPAVAVEQVEGEEDEVRGVAAGDPVLQFGKARGAVGGERDQLAVDQRALDRERGQRPRQRREFLGPVEPVAGDQPDRAALDPGQQPVAVVFDLVQPFRSVGRGVRRGGKLRDEPLGHRPLHARRACEPMRLSSPAWARRLPAGRRRSRRRAANPRPGRDRRRSRRSSARSRR